MVNVAGNDYFPPKSRTKLAILLFIFYLIICSWLVLKLSVARACQLQKRTLIALFLLKIAAGEAYGYIYSKTGGDTWDFHTLGLGQRTKLLNHPLQFIAELFRTQHPIGYRHIFDTNHSFWNVIGPVLIEKSLAIFDLFSGSNYYINVIFFSLLTFPGLLALYRFFYKHSNNKVLSLMSIFLVPSVLFWCSGIHKDGILLAITGCLLYYFDKIINDNINFRNIIVIIACLAGIFAFRNMVFLLITPALAAWFFSRYFYKRSWLSFLIIYTLFAVLFFNLGQVNKHLDLPAKVVQRQEEFQQLSGQSRIALAPLSPSFNSFLHNAPQALYHTLLWPFPWEGNNFFYKISGLEILIVFVLIVFALIIMVFKRYNFSPFLLFCYCFGVSSLIIIGYIVPFIGAFTRYRSLLLPFLIIASLVIILKKLKTDPKYIRIIIMFKKLEELI